MTGILAWIKSAFKIYRTFLKETISLQSAIPPFVPHYKPPIEPGTIIIFAPGESIEYCGPAAFSYNNRTTARILLPDSAPDEAALKLKSKLTPEPDPYKIPELDWDNGFKVMHLEDTHE